MATSASVARLVLVRGGGAVQDTTTVQAGGAANAAPSGADRADQFAADARLAMALIRRDHDAPYQAWIRFLPMVRGNLRRSIGPGLDEDDLIQEVFLRFFQRVASLREPTAVRGFLFAICLRVAQKELRRRWLRRWLRLTDDGSLPEVAPARGGDSGEREARDAVARYYAILDAVGGNARSLFVSRFIEGMELLEVARIHGLSVSTTQRRLARVSKRVEAMVRRDSVLAEFADRATEVSP